MPVERWAENVNRYYGSQNAAGVVSSPGEELSELESLYQASLQAPSMQRGARGVSPQPANGKPAVRKTMSGLAGHGRSKTPTAEIERHAYRTPVTPTHKPVDRGFADDENYSAENLRRLARSLSGTGVPSRPLTLGPSHSIADPRSFSSLRRPSNTSSSSLHLHPPTSPADPLCQRLSPHMPPAQQPARAPHMGPLSWGHSGVGSGVQQRPLVVCDGGVSQSLHSVAMSYGTLPRAPRRAPCSPSRSSLPRPKPGPAPFMPGPAPLMGGPTSSRPGPAPFIPGPAPLMGGPTSSRPGPAPFMPGPAPFIPGPAPLMKGPTSSGPGPAPSRGYATLSHPRRSAPALAISYRRQPDAVTMECAAQPRRLDVPPEGDWRRPPGHAPQPCLRCRQALASPARPYCPPCGAYMARFHPAS